MEKIYQNIDVYTAFQQRLDFIFSEFDNIYVSFSGGKDSGVLYHLVLKYMHEHEIRRKIGLFHQDFEAQYSKTTDFVTRIFTSAPDFVEKFWCCLPMGSKTCVSSFETCWYPWDPDKKDLWVRDMPDFPFVVNLDNNPFDFYEYKMMQESMYRHFNRWYQDHCGGGKTISLIGIRANESLNRYNAIINKKHSYDNKKYITCNPDGTHTAAPMYDWETDDIWTATGKFDLDYNRIYDLYQMAGVPARNMRVASPFNEWAIPSLNFYREIEPEAWSKMVQRVGGANFAALYGSTKAMAYQDISLPAGYTWESYLDFLLDTLPDDMRQAYNDRFRGRTDWREMCVCILKNDHTGKSLGKKRKKEDPSQRKARIADMIRGKGV